MCDKQQYCKLTHFRLTIFKLITLQDKKDKNYKKHKSSDDEHRDSRNRDSERESTS